MAKQINKIVLILFLILIGCDTKINPSDKKQIEKIKHEIINQALNSHLDLKISEIKKDENYPFDFKKLIFENSISIEYFNYGAYEKLIPNYYDIEKQDSLYPIKKWDKQKLDNYKIIDTIAFNRYKRLNESDFDEFYSIWEKEIGYGYMNISNPIFNSDFTKCLIYFYYTDFDWICGTGKDRLYEFTKTGYKWSFSRDLLNVKY